MQKDQDGTGFITEFVLLSNTAGHLAMATWVAVLIYAEKEELVSDALISIAWLFVMILHYVAQIIPETSFPRTILL